ncbi:acetyl-CoA carboxylase biotin carboxylase subunit [uncultured Cohaesibacter sp.]|uniref:acetyl-CoA carboxylase biotin carboxylase subunit n=1 Tax=uncultured Cohaesibacter sp. TaxID=1002546 RepID=UPI0029C83C56|nr:acetyl-CoA carboxylase biotin carboxylase subunit [uncultured Cohaesibacter sp.]
MKFSRILIANRGEIAVRIIRACQSMGITAIIAHSQADSAAAYVRLADESICIGPSAASKSYLNIPALLFAAESCKADAIHPGYGFLSESADFAQQIEEAGFVFIGPSPHAIRTMGDKIRAKQSMQEAGIPCIPGSSGSLPDDFSQISSIAEEIGYPVMIKAVSGGGGRGMRVVTDPAELKAAITLTREEARSAFGNPALYIERYLQRPRHVEIQLLCDGHGNAFWVGDRDCSLQRRNQKVIEESPAMAIDRNQIAAIGELCVTACQRIGYQGVGTFEFLYEDGHFFFVEMNTRLQVEHPVTELTSGLDLVQQQIRVAEGEPLRLKQQKDPVHGHAIECRLNAEDPESFAPCPGTISLWQTPDYNWLRIDTHIHTGHVVSPYYDSLIAKIITYGSDREQALARMEKALSEIVIEGVKTNLPLLQDLLKDPAIQQGAVDIHFIQNRSFET